MGVRGCAGSPGLVKEPHQICGLCLENLVALRYRDPGLFVARPEVHRGAQPRVLSKVPPRRLRTVAPGREAQTHEPHPGQIHQIISLPLSTMRWTAFGSPRTIRKAPSGSTQPIENALLVMRWQSMQWQV